MIPPEAGFDALPNFFILGAAKAGTTTLTHLLRRHPQVYMPFDKEPLFFSRDAFYARGAGWYAATFFRGAAAYPARGEASPHYLYWSERTAPRIQATYGEQPLKFVLILREPAQRAYSWYWNMVKEGREDRPFEEALALEDERLRANAGALQADGSMQYGYVRGGRYAAQLEPFLARFPRDRFLFLLQEDLSAPAFAGAWPRLLSFLGIDAGFMAQVEAHNPASMPRSQRLQETVQGPGRWKEWIKRVLPQRLRYRLKTALLQANARVVQYPPMPAETARALRARFREDNRRLEALTGRDLSGWNPEEA